METVPLIPKTKVLPNLDATPLLRELFQDELEAEVPSQKLSQNILRSLKNRTKKEEEVKPCGDKEYLENYSQRTQDVVAYTEHVLEAYEDHNKKLKEIRDVEKHILEAHAHYLKREKIILENTAAREAVCLKRQPLLKALDVNYVRKYKLLQGDAGLPFEYEAKSDFRVKKFAEWRRKLETANEDDFCFICFEKGPADVQKRFPFTGSRPAKREKKKPCFPTKQMIQKTEEKLVEIFTTDPKILFFTNYKLGYIYIGHIKVKNTSSKPVQFLLKPMCDQSPFRVKMSEKISMSITPGLGFQLSVEFTPKSLDNAAEDIVIVTEDGNRFLIPLIAYLEPPILKTHKEINEFTKDTTERIASSYIECGSCFTGDSKVIKLNFRCYRGSGEFFIMSFENWSTGNINTVTFENLLEIPPFRVYPVFFKVEKNQIIDLFVEFTPKYSGMQVENIVIACDNGQIRSLDLIGDAVGWHSYYFSFQDSLLKELSVDEDDDVKVKYYLDFEDTSTNGKVEKVFCVSNNSDMTFEFQWKIREANILSTQEKYLKLSKYQVKIDPENGTFEPKSVWEFLVTITFNNAEIGNYRMVLSLYVLNLPYQCIEEDNTIIQPTGLVRNLYSQSLYGEEEASALSPELTSLQGTYESLQESIKSYMEFQNRAQAAPKPDFCRTICAANPGLCAKPLKKSKTLFNIGETLEDLEGACRQAESNSESCTSNRDEKMTEMSPQRNEIIWDFVDILVDEVELWVEVVPTRVSLQPSLIEISNPIYVNDYPISKEVRIINHNRSPVTCSWLMSKSSSPDPSSDLNKSGSTMLSLLFDKNSLNKVPTASTNGFENPKNSNSNGNQSEEKTFEDSLSKDSNVLEFWDISIKPCKDFTVPGLSDVICRIGIIAYQPGQIKQTFWLNINDGDLQLKMIIKGLAVVEAIETSPDILDFGALKQGTRYTENFTISNQCSLPLHWKINHFKFDFNEKKFLLSDVKDLGSIKNVKGVLAKKGNSTTESYRLNAKAPGIQCSLIEVERTNVRALNSPKHYIMVLADVRMPEVWLSAPKFENAILALSGTVYVGQTQRTTVTLTNKGMVDAFLTWGYPFGCHSRNIKVEISPKSCKIEKKQKLTINFELTPLQEGIVSHCYIPCFFCRSAQPLILSIVGVAHTVNVTFEIIDYPMQNHADARNFLKSPFYHTILRIPWPIKVYNPTLGLKYLNETDILNLFCRCNEVEEEAARAFHDNKQECARAASHKTTQSLKSFEISDSGSLKSKGSFERSSKTVAEDEMQDSQGSCDIAGQKSEENSLCYLTFFENVTENAHFSKSHLEFLNVPFRTTTLRQFVIRNETPIETNFQINVFNYAVSKNLPDKRLELIKNRVFGFCNDEFQNKLMQDQPLVFEVEPSEGLLKGFEAVCINVYCYGNTWGEYRDCLICQIKGIEPFNLKIFAQIVGHPLYFPNFKTNISQRATLRFEPLSPVEQAVWKPIKVVNRSAIPLDISWMVFLTKPLPNVEEQDESNGDACTDSVGTLEMSHSDEGSTQSSKNYIPKNTSDAGMDLRGGTPHPNFSQTSESKTLSMPESSSSMKKEKKESVGSEKKSSGVFPEETKSDTQFQFPGVLDVRTFQVKPKEMSFKPFEEKKIMITFNPDDYRSNPQEIKGVLTGCVKLKPEHENCPGLYYRPCGIGFVSELLDFAAAVEVPLVSFEILKGDLRFIVDSNAVIKSQKKSETILRKFFIKNLNQKSLCLKIDIVPGTSFEIKNVSTIDKFYPEYNSKCHALQVEAGHILEMELQCTISYKNVMYAFEQLKINRMKETCAFSPQLGETKRSSFSKSTNDFDNETDMRREPWKHYHKNKNHYTKRVNLDYCKLGHNDSFHININRMSSKSDNSTCYDYQEGKITSEYEGEYLELPCAVEVPCKPQLPKHTVVSKEEIIITHSGTITQTLTAEVHISFPVIKISPKNLDFGNVYLGEMGIRYCSLKNLTGFPVKYRVLAKFNGGEFMASPLTGNLPPANYNCNNGDTLTVKFTPSQPGNYSEIFYVYCNMDLEFDFFELSVSGFGTWNEKYKKPKYESPTKIDSFYSKRSK